jgi:hypothetical protein
MVTHRWWGNKFCKRTCKDAYLRELALDRDKIRRWYGFPSRAGQAGGCSYVSPDPGRWSGTVAGSSGQQQVKASN